MEESKANISLIDSSTKIDSTKYEKIEEELTKTEFDKAAEETPLSEVSYKHVKCFFPFFVGIILISSAWSVVFFTPEYKVWARMYLFSLMFTGFLVVCYGVIRLVHTYFNPHFIEEAIISANNKHYEYFKHIFEDPSQSASRKIYQNESSRQWSEAFRKAQEIKEKETKEKQDAKEPAVLFQGTSDWKQDITHQSKRSSNSSKPEIIKFTRRKDIN